jgi:hypothetical protein
VETGDQQIPGPTLKESAETPQVLTGEELYTKSQALFQSFNRVLDSSLVVQQALEDDPPDPDWPDKKTHFTIGKGEQRVIYRINRKPVLDDAKAQIGQELYLLRADWKGNEEQCAVRIGGEPAIEYRGGMIETTFPVIFNSPDGSKTVGGTILSKRQVFGKKGALAEAIRNAPRKDRYYAPPNSEEAAQKANELLNRVRPELNA